MGKTHRVFVYGTLLVGERNHHVAQPHLIDVESGSVKGYLYNVGAYPALVLDEMGTEIVGEWITVTEEGLRHMDLLEDYVEGRGHNLYERVWVKDAGTENEGFVYVFEAMKASKLPLIEGGSWRHRHGEKENC
ncbi:gamma-glutamylcyclotransferase [Bacillus timonensis]|nr:gamma-glutamylcyclotransferase [Bacillus timonensis]